MLKSASYQRLGFPEENQLLQAFELKVPSFGFHWHYHPEYEITYIKNGRGRRLVGDHSAAFESGDFVLLGANLPHTWISDDEFNQSEENMEVWVLQFQASLFQEPLLSTPEMKSIRGLLDLATRGIVFPSPTKEQASTYLGQIVHSTGFERFQLFLSLMNFLGHQNLSYLLASPSYLPPTQKKTEERITQVCQYVHKHYQQPIKLEVIAQMAHMNPTSFCRFFRKSTGQSLSEYVSDLRIGRACNLLLENKQMSIAEIGFVSGFPSQTLFNRTFRKKKGMTPRAFRKLAIR